MTVTKNFSEAVYDYETATALFYRTKMGDSAKFHAIYGKDVPAVFDGKQIIGHNDLHRDVMYIFRLSKEGTKYVPMHVSMLPKTRKNLEWASKHLPFALRCDN